MNPPQAEKHPPSRERVGQMVAPRTLPHDIEVAASRTQFQQVSLGKFNSGQTQLPPLAPRIAEELELQGTAPCTLCAISRASWPVPQPALKISAISPPLLRWKTAKGNFWRKSPGDGYRPSVSGLDPARIGISSYWNPDHARPAVPAPPLVAPRTCCARTAFTCPGHVLSVSAGKR